MYIEEKYASKEDKYDSRNIEKFKKALDHFFEIKKDEIKKRESELEEELRNKKLPNLEYVEELRRLSADVQTKIGLLNTLDISVSNLDIYFPDKTMRTNVNNLASLIRCINSNTKNELKELEKSLNKDKKSYLKDRISSFKKKSKELEETSKEKYFKKTIAHAGANGNRINFNNSSLKITDVISEYIKQGKHSINFNFTAGMLLDKFKFEPKNQYFSIKSRLEDIKPVFGKLDSKTRSQIKKIENKYNEIIKDSCILNLLERAKKYTDVYPNIYSKTGELVNNLIKKYSELVNNLDTELTLSYAFLDRVIGENKINPTNTKEVVADENKDVNIEQKEKTEESINKANSENIDKDYTKLVNEKIEELDSSLSFSVPNFVEYKKLPPEKQYLYRSMLDAHLNERMGKSNKDKALIDAKFQYLIEEKIYDNKRDINLDIENMNDFNKLGNKEKQIIESFERKLSYIDFEKDFKNYEAIVKNKLNKSKDILNTNSPLVNSLEKQNEKTNEGGFTR